MLVWRRACGTAHPVRGSLALVGAQGAPLFPSGPITIRIAIDAGVNMMKFNRRRWLAAFIVTAAATITMIHVVATRAASEPPFEPIVAFSTMRGNVPGVDINDNTAAGAPWVIADSDGILTVDGEIIIAVRGLVFAPSVPKVGGTNTVPHFRAIVSCTTVVNNVQEVVNITTRAFPADAKGNSFIQDRVTLPNPCYAPIIFVGPATGNEVSDTELDGGGTWFAVTGN
jgi:hypothetical protein